METAPSRHAVCQSANITRIDMGDLLDAINSLPDRAHCAPGGGYPWDAEKDAALLAGWNKKPQELVCKILGCAPRTARKRYKELTDAMR